MHRQPVDRKHRPSDLSASRPRAASAFRILRAAAFAAAALAAQAQKFDFGTGAAAPGYVQVTAAATYTAGRGHGFEFQLPVTCVDRGGADALRGDVCFGDKPFYFSVKLPEGNYTVTLLLGDPGAASTTTVKAESRRLFVEKAYTAAGAFETRVFTVNRQDPIVSGSTGIALSDVEKTGLNWGDDKLTFEFNGAHPAVNALEIAPASQAVQLFLAGNSTVCDWEDPVETSWGQMFPRLFKPEASVVNIARSGLTAGSFIGGRRLDKIMSRIKAGDYLFVEFAHNDMKVAPASASVNEYKANLKAFLDQAKAKGATPVLVTPTARRSFDGQGRAVNTFVADGVDFLAAMKQVAVEQNARLIDLNLMSSRFIEALGPAQSPKAYNTDDNTHWNNYGAHALARCVAEGIKTQLPALAAHLNGELPAFNPSQPDPVDAWSLPVSPAATERKPTGIHAASSRPGARPATGALRLLPGAYSLGVSLGNGRHPRYFTVLGAQGFAAVP